MRNIGSAAAVALVAGVLGGVVEFFITRFLVERVGIVEGPPAGVLLITLTSGLGVVSASVAFFVSLWRLWKRIAGPSR